MANLEMDITRIMECLLEIKCWKISVNWKNLKTISILIRNSFLLRVVILIQLDSPMMTNSTDGAVMMQDN